MGATGRLRLQVTSGSRVMVVVAVMKGRRVRAKRGKEGRMFVVVSCAFF